MHSTRPYPARWHRVVSAVSLALFLAPVVAGEHGRGQGSGGTGSGSGSGSRRERKISRRVRQQMDDRHGKGSSSQSEKLDVLVRFRNVPGGLERALVEGEGGDVRREHGSKWMAARLPASAIEALSESDDVEYMASDAPVSAYMNVARAAAGAPGRTGPRAGTTAAV